jgi:tetratricopeptide (TPR) repeat protein
LRMLILASLAVAWMVGCVHPGTSVASNRSEAADLGRAGLARVDSLLNAGQAAAAVKAVLGLQMQLGTDPLYGWQIEGRLGLALLRAGRPAEAMPHLEAVTRRDPNDPVAHRNFANALLATGKKGRALTEFSLAVELSPDDYEARLEYGQALADFRDVRGSRIQLETARSLCPDCREPDVALAGLFLEAGQYEAALPPLQRINERAPNQWSRLSYAQALTGTSRDRELLEFLDIRPVHDLSGEEMNLAVQAEGRLGEADRSLAYLRVYANPDGPAGTLNQELLLDHGFWGRISLNLLETGHYPEGLQAADLAIGLDGDNVVYRNNRVVLLLKLDRQDEAAREWEEVLRLDPSLEKKENK